MGFTSAWHWIIVLVIVLLVFGTKRLRGAGRDLGEAVKGFKDGMRDPDKDKPASQIGNERSAESSQSESERDRSQH